MIVDAVLDAGFAVLEWLITLLPTFYVDCSGLSGLNPYMGWLDGWINLGAIGAALATIVAAEAVIMTARGAVWAWEHVLPG